MDVNEKRPFCLDVIKVAVLYEIKAAHWILKHSLQQSWAPRTDGTLQTSVSSSFLFVHTDNKAGLDFLDVLGILRMLQLINLQQVEDLFLFFYGQIWNEFKLGITEAYFGRFS